MGRERKIDMVILGLLSHEDLAGYDIKKRIDGAIRFFWKGSFGNIYPSLREMEKEQLITKYDMSVGSREKTTYQITEKGKVYLKTWLKKERVSNELKYETLLKLFFGGAQTKEVSLHNIEIFEKQIRSDLEIIQMYYENLKKLQNEDDHIYYLLTASFGIETYEAYLKWCDNAKRLLTEKSGEA